MCKNKKISMLYTFAFLVVMFLIESIVSFVFFVVIAEYNEQFINLNTINPILLFLGFVLLGVLYKVIFESWLVYVLAIISARKNKEKITKKSILLSRKKSAILVVSLFVLSVFIANAFQVESILKLAGIITIILGIALLYVIPIVISYLCANKYLKVSHAKNT